jgi:hypothetical protein
MEPVVKDAEDGEDQTDTDQDQQTDTDRTEGEDSVTPPSQSRSPSVHAQDAEVDVFDGYSFKGRHSVVIDDDENSDLGDEEDEYEEDEEDISLLKSPTSEDTKDQESAMADTEDLTTEAETEEEREAEPRTPEARPTILPAEAPMETKPVTEPSQPTGITEPPAPTKRPSADLPRPSVDSQRSETSSKSGKLSILHKASAVPRSSRPTGKRREKSGIAALDKDIGDSIDELTEREEEDEWDFVEAGVDEERNGSKGTSLFARGVVDRYKLAVFRKSTPSRNGNRTTSGTSKRSGTEAVSPSPSEKQSRGHTPLSFRKKAPKTPPTSFSSSVWDKVRDHMPRVRKLAVKAYHLDALDTSLGSPIFAPNLQTIEIHKIGTQNRPLPLFFNGNTPKSSSIRLSGISNWTPNNFTGLKRLSIENVPQELPIDNFLDLLKANPTLEHLELWNAELTPEPTSHHITLPHLRQLKFGSGSHQRLLASLSLPSTCQLELTSMVLDSLDRYIFEHAFPSQSPSLPNIIGDVRKSKINIGDGMME